MLNFYYFSIKHIRNHKRMNYSDFSSNVGYFVVQKPFLFDADQFTSEHRNGKWCARNCCSSKITCCTCYQNKIVIIFRRHCLISAATFI